ncbi:MAG: ABC transporter substrate-binding protein [Bauldia sp.]
MRLTLFVAPAIAGAALLASPSQAQDAVTFATNWFAEGEHGGFYQALADGTYERFGLDVTILPGGPQSPNRQLLLAGQVQFYMAGNLLQPIFALQQDVPPIIEVAAIFQKEPQVFLAHPEAGLTTLADLATLDTIFMGTDVYSSIFTWMKATFPGFTDEQYRPYTFSPAPFLQNPRSAQQGYVTSEPFFVRREGGFDPQVFLVADYGFDTPSTMIEARADFVEANPDIVQRFVDASIIGWYTYLYGDNSLGNALIKEENPEMTDDLLAFTLEQMLAYELIDSGAALEGGIGCFDDARVQSFYDAMVASGVVNPGLDLSRLYTNRFVCRSVGAELRPAAP